MVITPHFRPVSIARSGLHFSEHPRKNETAYFSSSSLNMLPTKCAFSEHLEKDITSTSLLQ